MFAVQLCKRLNDWSKDSHIHTLNFIQSGEKSHMATRVEFHLSHNNNFPNQSHVSWLLPCC